MPPRLATPFFSTGPDDSVATVDVYGDGGNSVINSFQEPEKLEINLLPSGKQDETAQSLLDEVKKISPQDLGVEKLLDSNTLIDESFGNIPTDLPGGVGKTGLSALKSSFSAVQKAVGGPAALLGNIKNSVKLGSAGSLLNGGKMNINLNGVTSVVSSLKSTAVSSIGGFVSELTQKADMFSADNKGGVIGALSSVASAGLKAGIPNILSAVTYGQTNKATLNGILKSTLPAVLGAGVGAIKDVATMPNMKLIPNSFPDYTEVMCSKYELPKLTGVNMDGQFKGLTDSLNLIEPNWNLKELSPNVPPALDLSRFGDPTPDFTKMVSTGASILPDSDPNKFLGMCGMFESSDMSSAMKTMYPKTVVMSGSEQKISSPPGGQNPLVMETMGYLGDPDYTGTGP